MPELDEKKRIIAYDTVNDPDENYYALIDNGTAGTGKVSIKGLGPVDMISDQYSDSSTYKVGDLCIHNNKLYVCTVAINTPHAFNLSEWELDTLGNYASQIKQSLADLSTNKQDKGNYVTRQGTAWGSSANLTANTLHFMAIVDTTFYIVWFAGSSDVNVKNIGTNENVSGTNSCVIDNVTFTRTDNTKLTIQTSRTCCISIYAF